MFTGIIEGLGKLERLEKEGSNINLWLSGPFTSELKIDQSLAHNGVCLTVVEVEDNLYKVTAIQETLEKSNLRDISIGDLINLERCMSANGRFDGHIVQGHVDQTATISRIEEQDGSWNFFMTFDAPEHAIVVPKGSVTINGVSLTVVEASKEHCSVSIIPFTYTHTNFQFCEVGHKVNIEFDILGKYVMEAQKRLAADA